MRLVPATPFSVLHLACHTFVEGVGDEIILDFSGLDEFGECPLNVDRAASKICEWIHILAVGGAPPWCFSTRAIPQAWAGRYWKFRMRARRCLRTLLLGRVQCRINFAIWLLKHFTQILWRNSGVRILIDGTNVRLKICVRTPSSRQQR